MDARAQRTLLRVGTLLGAIVICTLIVVFVPNLDPRFMEAVYGLGITAALGLDQWIKNTGENAPPTVGAVNEALKPALAPVASITATPTGPVTFTMPAPSRTVAPPSESRSA